jgi:hypothetical protein
MDPDCVKVFRYNVNVLHDRHVRMREPKNLLTQTLRLIRLILFLLITMEYAVHMNDS